MDRLAHRISKEIAVRLSPGSDGWCVYGAKNVLDQVGYFDEITLFIQKKLTCATEFARRLEALLIQAKVVHWR
jgi:hypothetical protein